MSEFSKLMGFRPQWSEPCDRHGNPINPDGTVQLYVEEAYSSIHYPKKNYSMSLLKQNGDKSDEYKKKSSMVAI